MTPLLQDSPRYSAEDLGSRQLVIDRATGDFRPGMPQPPRLSSADSAVNGLLLEEHAGAEVEFPDVLVPRHSLIMQLTEAAPMEIQVDSQSVRTVRKVPGQVIFLPAHTPISVKTRNTGDFIGVTLDPNFFYFAVHELVNSDNLAFKPNLNMEDNLLKELLLTLQTEIMQGNPGGRIYAEFLGASMAMHLARHYSSAHHRSAVREAGLPPHQLRRVLDFIQTHLVENISLETLATAAGLSPFHFARQFKKSTGLAPHQFIIQRRIQRAKELLTLQCKTIAAVALEVGFCDQSHFASHFKRLCKLTPKAFVSQINSRKILH